jgi:hypothetical protein
MSSTHTIIYRKECPECDNLALYNRSHKYPFHCYRPDQTNNPAIKTSPNCGGHFVAPSIVLKTCKYFILKKEWPK